MPVIDSSKVIRWSSLTHAGALEVSINLAKPEKDPKDIAQAAREQSGSAPCDLCRELEAGGGEHVVLAGETWLLKESPYGYCEGHCCVTAPVHRPMSVDRASFERLFAFVDQRPGMFIGMNADLPIVGGSILAHDHFQGGKYMFPLQKAPVEFELALAKFPHVQAGVMRWPVSVVRLCGLEREQVLEAACQVHETWAEWDDKEAGIISHDALGQHNTTTSLLRKNGGIYQLDLALRCNITSLEHPLGVFHPHEHLWHIKKENIGLIEVAGLAILPARVQHVMEQRHLSRDEVAELFAEVLECAGVFKWDEVGRAACTRFCAALVDAAH